MRIPLSQKAVVTRSILQVMAVLLIQFEPTVAEADTRGPLQVFSCPIDGTSVVFAPIKSRMVSAPRPEQLFIHAPELHRCGRCGYVADAPEWQAGPQFTVWQQIEVLYWLAIRTEVWTDVELWAHLGERLGLPAMEVGMRYIMAASTDSRRRTALINAAESVFRRGQDLLSQLWEAELRWRRGDPLATAAFIRISLLASENSMAARWSSARLKR